MKGLTSYRITTKARLKSIAESAKITEALIKHYTYIFENYEEAIRKHDEDIAEIEAIKAEIWKTFIEAPERLIQLNQHLSTLQGTRQDVTSCDSKVKRYKDVLERLREMEKEFEEDGVDIDEQMENIERYEEMKTAERAAAKRADDAEAVAREAAVELV